VAATVALAATSLARADTPHWPVWLCRPGHQPNYCVQNLNTTAILPDGSSEVETIAAAKSPPIDCFYAYPTVSQEHRNNSDLKIQPAEQLTAFLEAAPFSQVCRVFAPMYHQVTAYAGETIMGLHIPQGSYKEEYADISTAWHDYLAHYNDGRPVVLIGHSEGAFLLEQLIQKELPSFRKQLVSAILLGGDVNVDAQNRFDGLPACTSTSETGCVVAYSSWDHTPPAGDWQTAASGGDHVLCVNPAALGGGSAPIETIFAGTNPQGIVPYGSKYVSYAYVSFPGRYTAKCVRQGQHAWLLVSPTHVKGDTRPVVKEELGPSRGLHPADVNLTLGNLVQLVADQTKAWRRSH
jgi:hypothetical protein